MVRRRQRGGSLLEKLAKAGGRVVLPYAYNAAMKQLGKGSRRRQRGGNIGKFILKQIGFGQRGGKFPASLRKFIPFLKRRKRIKRGNLNRIQSLE